MTRFVSLGKGESGLVRRSKGGHCLHPRCTLEGLGCKEEKALG